MQLGVQFSDLRPRHLVSFRRAKFRRHDLHQDVPVEGGRSRFALCLDMLGKETLRQLRNGWRPALGGLLPCRIVTVRHSP